MAVEFMAWNVLDAFSDGRRVQDVLDVVKTHQPDAAVISEAWAEGKSHYLPDVVHDLEVAGYAVAHGLYQDIDNRYDRHGIMGIAKTSKVLNQQPEVISLESRNAVHLPVVDDEAKSMVHYFGVHLDDRREYARLQQADTLIAMAQLGTHVAIGGDLSAFRSSDPWAPLLNRLYPLARRLPKTDPRPGCHPPTLKRFGSLMSWLAGMASGATLSKFEDYGFEDSDPRGEPTKGPFRLDRFLTRGLWVDRTYTHPKSSASNHRAVSLRARAQLQ